MKKLLLSLVAIMAIGVSAWADGIIVPNTEVRQGKSGELQIILKVDTKTSYSGFQFDVKLPTGATCQEMTYKDTSGDDQTGPKAVQSDVIPSFLINTSYPDSEDKQHIRIIGFGLGTGINYGEDGEFHLITIPFDVDKSLPASTSLSGSVTEIKLSDSNNKNIEFTDVNYNINIVENIITLDENSTTVPEAEEDVNVKVLRTIKANVWNTICLPFAMTEEQVKEAFGNDVQIADFVGCEGDVKLKELSGEPDFNKSVKVKFESVSSMEANHPYLIKVSEALNDFTVNNVNIAPDANDKGLVYLKKDEYKYGGRNKTTVYDSFIGTYVAETKIPEYGIFLSNNQFKSSVSKSKLNAFRAYFDFGVFFIDTDDTSSVKYSISLDEATAIDNIDGISVNSDEWYDLSGRKLDKTPKVKGIYINNGKKHLVK